MQSVTFTIPGKPFAWRRARSNGVVRFKDKASVAHAETLQAIALPHFPAPLEGPLKLRVVATFEIPRSWSKRRQAEAEGAYHAQRPDQDNIQKQLKDALNRIAWTDDAQVADARCVKRWGRHAETVITIEALA